MRIPAAFGKGRPVVSFEFFPPKTDEGLKKLDETIAELKLLRPDYVSCTWGAGGSTRDKTIDIVTRIKRDFGLEAMAHFTCVGYSRDEIRDLLHLMHARGVENILALRGDPPKGEAKFVQAAGGFAYASDLVGFIKTTLDRFGLCVAGYPEVHVEAKGPEEDLANLKRKVDLGGQWIITQLFFDNRDFYAFRERCRAAGISVPIVAGIMPVQSVPQVRRMAGMCGSKVPADLDARLRPFENDPDSALKVGIDHATRQVEELLLRGVDGIHFYCLNKSGQVAGIFRNLGLAKEGSGTGMGRVEPGRPGQGAPSGS